LFGEGNRQRLAAAQSGSREGRRRLLSGGSRRTPRHCPSGLMATRRGGTYTGRWSTDMWAGGGATSRGAAGSSPVAIRCCGPAGVTSSNLAYLRKRSGSTSLGSDGPEGRAMDVNWRSNARPSGPSLNRGTNANGNLFRTGSLILQRTFVPPQRFETRRREDAKRKRRLTELLLRLTFASSRFNSFCRRRTRAVVLMWVVH
jgi:hypothetical protein